MKGNNSLKFNVKITMLLVSFLFVLISAKLIYVAISTDVDGIDLTAFASNRNTEKKTTYASRGSIYYSNGEELAIDMNSYTVIAYLSESRTTDKENPEHVVDKERTARELAPILTVGEETILERLNRENLYQVELKRGITESEKNQILALGLPGIDFTKSIKRYYPNGSYASFILGYAKPNDYGEVNGEMGLELYFNDTLKGKNGSIEYQKDAYGYQIPNTPVIEEKSVSGKSMYLTLNEEIQHLLENSILNLEDNYTFDWANMTVMNAKTGAILGSASSPNFDLNKREDLTSYLNPLVSYQYEPGSVMKIFSFMSAIENGKYDGSKIYKSGSISLKDGTIINDVNKTWGDIDFDTGFARSSNVAATLLSQALGAKKLRSFYDTLGFGKPTKIELPNEAEGKITFKYESEVATASFGQGITVTPIQMLQALTTLANDGVMVKPYLVSKIVDENGNIVNEYGRTEVAKVASKETIAKMKELMYKVVYGVGDTNKAFAPDNVTLMGKTGTAQIASPKGGYLTGDYDYIKSFAGLFPYEDPKYIVYVSIKQIVGGTKDIAKIVHDIVEESAKALNIVETASDADESKIIALSNFISKEVVTTVDKLKNRGLEPITIGEGKYVVNQYPLNNQEVLVGTKVFLLTNATVFKMPNAIGWSVNEIVTFCNLIGLPYELHGYGKVKTISIIPGDVIDKATPLEITGEFGN